VALEFRPARSVRATSEIRCRRGPTIYTIYRLSVVRLNPMHHDHVNKRETPVGRWLPVLFYTANLFLWLLTGVAAELTELAWLVILPLSALALYLARTKRRWA